MIRKFTVFVMYYRFDVYDNNDKLKTRVDETFVSFSSS